jgi:hypothetical protein
MSFRRFISVPFMLLLLAACDGILSSDPVPTGIFVSSVPTTLLEVDDTTVLTAGAYGKGGAIIEDAVRWTSLDPAVAILSTKGRVIGRAPGHATIRAMAGAFSMDVQITVNPRRLVSPSNTVCAGSGPRHFGRIPSGRWAAKDNPHFIRDIVTVTTTLTIEAGTLICAFPGARISVPDTARLTATGTASQPVHFTATDPAVGWTGIGSNIVFDHVRVEKAQTVGGTGSFTTVTLRNSVVDSGQVFLSAGIIENTVIRYGNLQTFGTRGIGGGTIKIDGVRIEDSPGIAFTAGDNNSITAQPTMSIVSAPIIVRASGTIVYMPLETFFGIWPTPAAQAALLDNASRTVSLWTFRDSLASAHLRGGLIWEVNRFGSVHMPSLTLDPGAELRLQAILNVDVLNASGTMQEPITLSSRPNCVGGGPTYVCGITVRDSASSRISNLRLVNSYLHFAH